MIKKVKIIDTEGNTTGVFDIGLIEADLAALLELWAKINFEVSSKGNFTIKSAKNINIEPAYSSTVAGDIALKPGDDIQFCSHHRPADKQNEVLLKIIDGDDNPVKFQIGCSEVTWTTKGKIGADNEEFNFRVNTGNSSGNTKGYLKIRARAIDLRCEEHGGVAIQPKGKDKDGNMNKIKFEHGGGDGLEFGTFNTEHSSLFTDDYRFNRDGIVKMATRDTEVSNKYDLADETTHYKYIKQADDTYDKIDPEDEQTTWHDIIKTSFALNHRIADDDTTTYPNGVKAVETSITSKGNLEIATNAYTKDGVTVKPSINIESANKLSLKGILDFGSTFNFGETETGIQVQHKYTAKGAEKSCDVLLIVVNNNSTTEKTWTGFDVEATCPASVTVPATTLLVVAQASIYDLIKFVTWAKANHFGPWAVSEV